LGEIQSVHLCLLETVDFQRPSPPHSTVRGSFTEIETIYRAYQVLLLEGLRT
jgi:hypothetical protein